ncbi:uncharacterized protein PGTG_22789 [Puccinia graminis f. sp. tritici CRL 75-36-700-3]|uniref:Uncharacterized protein n=1 Tax=Puccinia graminis f. sp. tritici (strain CRL 75-36-700-3 / race SCCL) TaxID=418459 RepID=H6QVL7_PUCGT|nr:uncharacterized protein PGTG_22789 [Puccinia graminis f. sp. tritici CRL 75-36-700-3]EHS63311.1 hypothetical protein PGTG_22789 [Puccinia graminis f. sp. tritici CRL 75-36-700-3]
MVKEIRVEKISKNSLKVLEELLFQQLPSKVMISVYKEKFKKLNAALIRACDRQSNRCADFFNKKGQGKTADCNAQLDRFQNKD